MQEHILQSFDKELSSVQEDLVLMGKHILRQLERFTHVLTDIDRAEARKIRLEDAEINGEEVRIASRVEQILARFQPSAVDLRLLLALDRMSVDLERMGDEIRNMAQAVEYLKSLDEAVLANRSTIAMALVTVGSMIGDVLDALIERDTATARVVIQRDEQIDNVFKTTVRSLITHMLENPRSLTGALGLNQIARSLERVGDHTTNIAEAVIYIVEGADIRHEKPLPNAMKIDVNLSETVVSER